MNETATAISSNHVVFLGDSLAQSGERPDGFLSLLRQSFVMPKNQETENWVDFEKVELVTAGAQRDKIAAGIGQIEKMNETGLRPNGLVLMLGLYDVWQQDKLTGGLDFEATKIELKELLSATQNLQTDAGKPTQVFLCTPLLIGEKPHGENSLDADLDQMSEVIRELGEDQPNCHVVDLRKTALDYLSTNNPNGRPHSILTIDGVHLNHNGHRLVAGAIAEKFGTKLPQPVERQLRHVVLLKFASKTPHGEILKLVEKFNQLDRLIPGIDSIESGENVSPEGKTKGFTHGFTLTFSSSAQRDAYLQDTNHRQFSAEIRRVADDVLVFDYWATNQQTK